MPTDEVFKRFVSNPSWRHQIVRILGQVSSGGGDVFEILKTVTEIRPDDREDWHVRWCSLAEAKEKAASEAYEKGFTVTASQLYLKACNYYRMADFYLPLTDPRELPTYGKIVECFHRAWVGFTHHIEDVEFVFQGERIPAYFMRSKEGGRAPTVILMGGADSVKEEKYFNGALACLRRGMNCVLVDGPGQGYPLRLLKMYLIPDYERFVSSVVDQLLARVDVDGERLAYVGSSLGGYFAGRVAAFEDRVRAVVMWGACYSLLEDIYDYFPPIRERINAILGARSEEEARRLLVNYTLKEVAGKIKTPLLILHGEDDYIVSPTAAKKVYEQASGHKELVLYRKGELGSLHSQHDKSDETQSLVFDWLKSTLNKS